MENQIGKPGPEGIIGAKDLAKFPQGTIPIQPERANRRSKKKAQTLLKKRKKKVKTWFYQLANNKWKEKKKIRKEMGPEKK